MKVKLSDYYRLEKKLLGIFLASSFAVTGMDIAGPILVKKIIDEIIPSKVMNDFYMATLILAAIYILRMMISIVSNSRGQLMGNRIKFHMKNDLYRKILNMPPAFFSRTSKGDMITRVTSDLETASTLLYRGIEDMLFSILSIAGSIIVMYRFNKTLSILTMIPLPFMCYYVIQRNRELKRGYRKIRSRSSTLTSDIHDCLRTIFFVKDNTLEEYKFNSFYSKNEGVLGAEKKNFLNIALLMSGIAFYGNLTHLIIIFAGGYLFIQEKISMGIIISFILLTSRFRVYLIKLMGLVDIYQRGMAGIDRFKEIMQIEDRKTKGVAIHRNIEKIELRGISLTFGRQKIFDNFSLTIEKGEKVAFIGESGIGKSTILNIIKGYIKPQEGEVLINGCPLGNIDEKDYLKRLGTVDQNEHIMSCSIDENLRVIKSNKKGRGISESLKLAEMWRFIKGIPDGIGTLVGEEGIKLSSGQQQRISLTRLFLKDPEVILMDEATNTLDNITEASVMNNIMKSFKDRTIVAVAHRLDTLKGFDRIYVLGEGGIVESGGFDELLRNKDEFYRMYKGG